MCEQYGSTLTPLGDLGHCVFAEVQSQGHPRVRSKALAHFLNLCFLYMQLALLSHSENHTLARPQPSLDSEVWPLSGRRGKMMSLLAVKGWRDYKIWSGI